MATKLPLYLANFLFPLAILLFASGFFPYKPFIPGLATFSEDLKDIRPFAPFDRVIFMVVDALRSDFVYAKHSGFTFTRGLIESGAALPFTAHAGAPTVTMPRVKAITTGSVPSFLDVILNLAETDTSSTLVYQDTWLAQLRARPGGRLVMYGDDTWLKLFPGFFDRHDGTTSFFVSDFVEVDNNVTRHVPKELMMDDWSSMILHYLGLDHIGHKSGPNSAHMLPKQREMDSVVRDIYNGMESQEHLSSTLLVLCGDHGMNEAGNHGGASPGETSPALIFISPQIRQIQNQGSSLEPSSGDFKYYQSVEQSDIAPTLAGLLGFPIPLNSLGVFIPQFLPMWKNGSERLGILMENARQIRNIVRTTFPAYEFSDSLKPGVCKPTPNIELASLECNWQNAWKLASAARDHNDHFKEAENALLTFCRSAQDVMSSAASNYNMERLCIGIFLAASAAVLSSVVSLDDMSGAKVFALFIAIAYGSMIFGSSYVEEEQQFWYWILSGWTFYLYARRGIHSGMKRSDGDGGKGSSMPVHIWGCMVFAVSSRIMRRWNQTGQKFAAEPDIARTFFPSYTNVLWILILLTYTDICQGMVRRTSSAGAASFSRLFFPILTSFALLFKLSFTAADSPELLQNVLISSHLVGSITGVSLITQARLVFTGIAIALVYVIYTDFQEKRTLKAFLKIGGKDGPHLPKHLNGTIASVRFPADLRDIVSLILVTQSRPTNIPLYLIFRLQHWALSSMELSGNGVTITSLILQYAAFFAMGGSNSIASVDLSNAYNGISNYNVVVVGILTFIGNWAGPIWWVFSTKLLFVNDDGRTPFVNRRRRSSHVALLTFFVTTSLLAVMVACTVLRTHLFIWTVFSPKFLYSMAWSLVQHLAINLLLGEAILKSIC
ncbi:phosphoethanolamine transferase [Histoplasma capsulatum var. duboisii H88]|uniref:GPI ethanolamine phosphate transferase 2 n=2 Tax=Ajellomyces capsulatus TaxID=5037 RepID=F0UQV8_AJEC8|nr:phosphoethanolamine transferase [Histoplasma capsulatum H143]EGC48285.1 phosphoethanolamine transferase [Histoplasma capsulatum var. duboisii H88]QSS50312.1 phosphoethanolamine transferase [Histoplasma capsulatum var. duboisii H88]